MPAYYPGVTPLGKGSLVDYVAWVKTFVNNTAWFIPPQITKNAYLHRLESVIDLLQTAQTLRQR